MLPHIAAVFQSHRMCDFGTKTVALHTVTSANLGLYYSQLPGLLLYFTPHNQACESVVLEGNTRSFLLAFLLIDVIAGLPQLASPLPLSP